MFGRVREQNQQKTSGFGRPPALRGTVGRTSARPPRSRRAPRPILSLPSVQRGVDGTRGLRSRANPSEERTGWPNGRGEAEPAASAGLRRRRLSMCRYRIWFWLPVPSTAFASGSSSNVCLCANRVDSLTVVGADPGRAASRVRRRSNAVFASGTPSPLLVSPARLKLG